MIFLTLLLLGLTLSALFSGLETGFYSLQHLRIQFLAKTNPKAKLLLQLLQKPQEVVCTTLVGTNLSNYIATSACTSFLLHSLQVKNPEAWSTLLLTPTIFLFSEIYPKELFRNYSEKLTFLFARFLYLAYQLFYPITWILVNISKIWNTLLGHTQKENTITRHRVKYYLLEEGGLSIYQHELSNRVFQMEKLTVFHLMQPLSKIVAVPENIPYPKLLQIIHQSKFSRYPVYQQHKKNILGFVHYLDILLYNNNQNHFQLTNYLRKLPSLHYHSTVHQAIQTLKNNHVSMALVVKNQEIQGIITLQDLLEPLIGDL